MLKFIKKLVIIVAISFIAIFVIGAILWIFFAPKIENYLIAKVQHTLENQFKREVSIGGLDLNFPNPQITIADIAIARQQKLSEGTLLSAKMLKAKVLLRTLLSDRILIDDIVLDSPTIWIEFDEQGQSNLPSFGGEKQEEQPKKESRFDPKKIVERLYSPSIQLVDGEIYFAHKKIPLTVSVQRLNTTLSLALKGFQVQGSISLQGGEFELQDRGKMVVAMSGDLKFEKNSLSLSSFHIQADDSELTLDGTLANITRPDLNLSVKTHLSLARLDQFLQINQNLTGIVDFEGTVTGPVPDITATGHLTCAKGTAWKLNFEDVSTDATYQQKQVIITNLDAGIFDGRASGNAELSFSGIPRFHASAVVNDVEIEYVNTLIEQQLPLSGRVNGKVTVRGESFDFEDMIIHAEPTIRDADAYDVKIPQATAQVDIKKTILSLQNLQAEVFQGKVVGNGSMALSSDPNYQAILDVQQVELDPIMALIPDPPDVSGQVSGKITASGAKFDLDSLKLQADLNAVNVDAYDIQAKTLSTSLQIQKSVLDISRASTQLFGGNVAAQGTLVLAGKATPKFDIRTKLQNISVQSLIRQFAQGVDTGGFAFNTKISGDVALTGNAFSLPDITGTAALSAEGDVSITKSTPRSRQSASQKFPINLALDGSLKQGIVTIADLSVTSDTLTLAATGTVDTAKPALNLSYQVGSKDIQTLMVLVLPFLPEMDVNAQLRQFSGKIERLQGTIQGPVSAFKIQAEAHVTNGDFFWAKASDATVDVTYQDKRLLINHARALHNSAEVEVSGVIDPSDPAATRLNLPVVVKSGNVTDYLAMVKQELPIEGTLDTLRATISGTTDNLQAETDLKIRKGIAWDQTFDSLSGKVAMANNQIRFHALKLKKNSGNIVLDGFLGFDLSFGITLTATDMNFRDIDAGRDVAVQYQGLADVTAEIAGTLENPEGKAAIRFKQLEYDGRPIEDVTCDIVMEDQSIQATLVTFRKKFIASFQMALTPELLYRMEMVMESAAVEQIFSLAVNIEGITGLISGKITSEGSLRDIHQLSAIVKLNELQLDVFGQQVKNSKEIDVVVTPKRLTVNSLELKGKELGLFARGFLDFQGNFDLDLDGIIDLRAVKPFLPETVGITSLDGHVQLICSVRGTFVNPVIEGIAEINRGRVQLQAYPDPVNDIQGKLAFTKGKIEIVRGTGTISKGSFVSYGTLNYDGLSPGTFSIDVEGKNITVQKVVEALTLKVSPHIKISGDLNRQKLAGEVMIHEALYTKDLDLRTLVFEKRRNIALPTVKTDETKGPVELDLFIKAPKNIQVRNKMAELDLRTNLRIQGTTQKPQLEGRVEVLKGNIQFGDIKYQILAGVFDFIDPLRINPEMNIRVETVVQEYDISLIIEGNLDQFSLDMSSEPELSKEQITRLLASGSGQGSSGYNVVTKPIQTLVEGQIEKALNLQRFTVDVDPLLSKSNGTGAQPKVTLGKRLFKDLMLTFSTTVGGTEQAQTVELEYEFSDNVSLSVKRDEEGQVDASFTFKFKIK